MPTTDPPLPTARRLFQQGEYARTYQLAARLFNDAAPGPEKSEAAELAGQALAHLRHYTEAQRYFCWLNDHCPGTPRVLRWLAINAAVLGDYELARNCADQLLARNPNDRFARKHRADCLQQLGRPDAACRDYLHLIELGGAGAEVHQNYLLTLLAAGSASGDEILAAHRRACRDLALRSSLAFEHRRPPGPIVNLGYFSPGFNTSVTGHFFRALAEHHDHRRFRVHLYSRTRREDDYTRLFRELADDWTDLADMDYHDIARRIHDDRIDILVDLAGHAPRNILPALGKKPAPIQVCMLDYFETTGLPEMDYFISDPWHSPPGDSQQFVEELVRLPVPRLCYTPPGWAPPVAPPPALANGHITFGSFHRQEKITPDVLALWCRVLHAVPGSRMLLKGLHFDQPGTATLLCDRFAAQGIDRSRIVLRGRSEHRQMLAEYADVDLMLDTFPWNSGLTCCEALWMGVPTITLRGNRLLSRQGSVLLQSAGLPDLIADSPDQYVAIARHHGAHPELLQALRARLRQQVAGSPLCDGAAYTAAFEQFLEQALQRRWQQASA